MPASEALQACSCILSTMTVVAVVLDIKAQLVGCLLLGHWRSLPHSTPLQVLLVLLQELYELLPLCLSPVLGNPIALAAKGIPTNISFSDQVSFTLAICLLACPYPPIQGELHLQTSTPSSAKLQATQLVRNLQKLIPQLSALAKILPAPTLAWKLELLREGNKQVGSRPAGPALLCCVAGLTGARLLGGKPCHSATSGRAVQPAVNGKGCELTASAGLGSCEAELPFAAT